MTAEDFLRNIFGDMGETLNAREIEFYVDRFKYSLKYGLSRILNETVDTTLEKVPRQVIPMLYTRTAALLHAGVAYSTGLAIVGSVHSGSAVLRRYQDKTQVVPTGDPRRIGYSAVELLGHVEQDEVPFSSVLFHWIRNPEQAPPEVQWIAETILIRKRLVKYRFSVELAAALATKLPQPPFLIPDGWEFAWGGRQATTLLANALSLRCFYHLVAVHFGSRVRAAKGGGYESICLTLSHQDLIGDIEALTSLSRDVVANFIAALTYGRDTQVPDPALQPIIEMPGDEVLVPCLHFLSSNQERNLLSLEARTNSNRFNSQSHLFEVGMTAELKAQVEQIWPWVAANRTLRSGKQAEEVDLLILDPATRTALVCELRWMIPPGDPREVQNRRRACHEKVNQLNRKLMWLRPIASAAFRDLFESEEMEMDHPWDVSGVVIIQGWGGTQSHLEDIPVLPVSIFRIGIASGSLTRLVEWARSLRWLPKEGVDYKTSPITMDLVSVPLTYDSLEILVTRQQYHDAVRASVDRQSERRDRAREAGIEQDPTQ